MEDNDPHRRQIDPPVFPGSASVSHNSTRHSASSVTDRFRQPASVGLRSPTSVSGRNGGPQAYGYGFTEGQHFTAQQMPTNSLPYQQQNDYSQEAQRQPQYPQYSSNLLYNVAPQGSQPSPYDSVQQYQPRQSAAIEVLSTQFGVPQYFVPGEPASAPGPAVHLQHATSQFPSLSYPQSSVAERSVLSQGYTSATMADMPQGGAPEALDTTDYGQESANYDDAYNQYQNALKQTFENTRNGRIVEAGHSLLEISNWLLGHAAELGLVRDEQELHSDRIKLWNEFNTCWLAVLQKQKELTEELLEAGQQAQHAPGILQAEFLNRMGRELVHLCDGMERHGLVDYQMGVWEEDIISILQQCLDLLEGDDDATLGADPPVEISALGANSR
ncbi:MAG: hypothetical protein M1836_002462 [Candelina mexicana]|nr:MAG: hypothetical protein M1836_002462 [Candelina mexicana]